MIDPTSVSLKKHASTRYWRLTPRRRGVQLEIERKLRGLLTKDKQKAEEEAALAIGLCRSVP